jgi:hypothetical protein
LSTLGRSNLFSVVPKVVTNIYVINKLVFYFIFSKTMKCLNAKALLLLLLLLCGDIELNPGWIKTSILYF